MLTEQFVYHVATLEERKRLARELHDHLAQDLGYLKIKASLVSDSLQKDDVDGAQAQLQEIKDIADGLYTDVREQIYSLRSRISGKEEFLPKLQEYLDHFQRQHKLETRLTLSDEALAEFSAQTCNQLFRIIQEALSNVGKHAQASRVKINLEPKKGQICLTVEDDGQGFDLDHLSSNGHNSFGLKIMRERAESIGGQLALDSTPGNGTRLSVSLGEPQTVMMLQPNLQ
jgi:signal transduction histidine kinase